MALVASRGALRWGRCDTYSAAVALRAAKWHRISELQVLDIISVDEGERRISLRIIGAVVHEPVLRLVVRIHEPLWGNLGRQRPRPGDYQASEHKSNAIHLFLLVRIRANTN
jgi:hypothetical protein